MKSTITSLRKTPHIKLGEIIGVNPNSFETVKAGFIKPLGAGRVSTKKEMGACRF